MNFEIPKTDLVQIWVIYNEMVVRIYLREILIDDLGERTVFFDMLTLIVNKFWFPLSDLIL